MPIKYSTKSCPKSLFWLGCRSFCRFIWRYKKIDGDEVIEHETHVYHSRDSVQACNSYILADSTVTCARVTNTNICLWLRWLTVSARAVCVVNALCDLSKEHQSASMATALQQTWVSWYAPAEHAEKQQWDMLGRLIMSLTEPSHCFILWFYFLFSFLLVWKENVFIVITC